MKHQLTDMTYEELDRYLTGKLRERSRVPMGGRKFRKLSRRIRRARRAIQRKDRYNRELQDLGITCVREE